MRPGTASRRRGDMTDDTGGRGDEPTWQLDIYTYGGFLGMGEGEVG